MYDYKATSDTIVRNKTDGENTWCMTIDAKKFIQLSDQFPEFRNFMLVRGLQRRAFLKLHEKDLIKRFDLKNEAKKIKKDAMIDYEEMLRTKPFYVSNEEYIRIAQEVRRSKFKRKR